MKNDLRKGICKGCGKTTIIQNKVKFFCKDCVYKANHGGKTQAQIQQERKAEKALKPTIPTRCKKYTYKKRNTGERQVFLEVWDERPHLCENCGNELGNIPKNYMFSHIKAKSICSSLRLDKSNIRLLCWDCHYALDFRGKEYYEQRKGKFNK